MIYRLNSKEKEFDKNILKDPSSSFLMRLRYTECCPVSVNTNRTFKIANEIATENITEHLMFDFVGTFLDCLVHHASKAPFVS